MTDKEWADPMISWAPWPGPGDSEGPGAGQSVEEPIEAAPANPSARVARAWGDPLPVTTDPWPGPGDSEGP